MIQQTIKKEKEKKMLIFNFNRDGKKLSTKKGREGVRCHYVTQVIVKGAVKGAFTGWFELKAQSRRAGKSARNTPACRNTVKLDGYQRSLQELP